MVRQTSVAGPVSRKTGVRLHMEMGNAGEDVWAKITGGTSTGHFGDPLTWRGGKPAPVDVVDYKNRIGYQIKVTTDPTHRVSFSGAHKNVYGTRIGGNPQYYGQPEDKLEDIREWLRSRALEGVLVVMLLDEDANRATVYAKRGVHNAKIREMTPIGVIDNDANVFHVPRLLRGGIEEVRLPIPSHVEDLPPFPDIPMFLRSSTRGEVVQEIAGVKPLFRRPPVRVRTHRRKR